MGSRENVQNGYANYTAGYPYSLSYELARTPNSTNDLLVTPGLSNWTSDNQPANPYTTSPLPSPDLYAGGEDESWDCFNEYSQDPFQPATLTNEPAQTLRHFSPSLPVTQQERLQYSVQGTVQDTNVPYIAPSLTQYPLQRTSENRKEAPNTSTYASSVGKSRIPIKGAWGSSKESKGHTPSSKPGRRSSRVKDKNEKPPSKRSSTSSSKGHQLRSTQKGHKFDIQYEDHTEYDAGNMEPSENPKASHNLVEKQYRNRLNGQFSNLLGVIPPDLVAGEIEGYVRDGVERKVSKGEVLDLSRRYIKCLEGERASLEGQNKLLTEDLELQKGLWVGMGGHILP